MRRVIYTHLPDCSAKAVLMAMAYHAADNGGSIHASVQSLAHEAGLSERASQYAIRRLTASGYIADAGQRKIRNGYLRQYQIVIDRLADQEPRAHGLHPTGAQNAPTGARFAPNLSVPVIHQQSDATAPRVLPIPRDGRTDSTATLSEEVHVDAVVDYFERAVRERGPAQIIEGWRGDAAAKDMCKAFAEIFPAPVTKGDSRKWLQGASRLVELGTTRAELVAARDAARRANNGEGAQLTHPGAVYEWIKGVRMRAPVQVAQPVTGRYIAREVVVNYDED